MRRCAFLSMEDLSGFISDDSLVLLPLRDAGWAVERVPWRTPREWDDFDVVIIRTTWDYHKDPDAFLEVLARIDRSSARLENSLDLVKWNMRKTYLRDLERQGIPIVPTLFAEEPLSPSLLDRCFKAFNTDRLIIKPVVSASADHTYPVRREEVADKVRRFAPVFENRAFLVQPFMRGIVEEGEFSLFYFGGEYSHTVLKTPKDKDFRVQEEHGGHIQAVKAERGLLEQAQKAMDTLMKTPFQARVDLVRDGEEGFRLMEFELIEPSLYFRNDPDSPARFAKALCEWMDR